LVADVLVADALLAAAAARRRFGVTVADAVERRLRAAAVALVPEERRVRELEALTAAARRPAVRVPAARALRGAAAQVDTV